MDLGEEGVCDVCEKEEVGEKEREREREKQRRKRQREGRGRTRRTAKGGKKGREMKGQRKY